MTSDPGASPGELLIEACRRNNTTLLHDILRAPPCNTDPPSIAHFLNTTVDVLGAGCLHIAAQHGSYDVLDVMLDQEGVEIDGREWRDGDTPLHMAVRFCGGGGEVVEHGRAVVEILLDAGCDPRIRNNGNLRPIDLADPRDADLRRALRNAEIALVAGDDVVKEDDAAGVYGPDSGSE